jgi:hypothetical protein
MQPAELDLHRNGLSWHGHILELADKTPQYGNNFDYSLRKIESVN